MAYETLSTTMLASADLGDDFATGGIDVSQYEGYYIQVVYSYDGDDSEGSINLQTSIDNTNWTDYPGSTQSVTSASTTQSWEVYEKYHRYVRVNYTFSTGSGGTADITAMFTREMK